MNRELKISISMNYWNLTETARQQKKTMVLLNETANDREIMDEAS